MHEAGLVSSRGSIGDAYDNAVAEAFFATLEGELIDRHVWLTREEARRAVFDYIEGFYDPRRRHSTLGYLSPAEFEGVARCLRGAAPAQGLGPAPAGRAGCPRQIPRRACTTD